MSSTAGPPVSVSNSMAKRGPTPERLVAGANSGKRISGRKGKIRPEEPDNTVRRLYILGLHEPNSNHREPAQAPALSELAPRHKGHGHADRSMCRSTPVRTCKHETRPPRCAAGRATNGGFRLGTRST